jgi:hypothetical protein
MRRSTSRLRGDRRVRLRSTSSRSGGRRRGQALSLGFIRSSVEFGAPCVLALRDHLHNIANLSALRCRLNWKKISLPLVQIVGARSGRPREDLFPPGPRKAGSPAPPIGMAYGPTGVLTVRRARFSFRDTVQRPESRSIGSDRASRGEACDELKKGRKHEFQQ